MFDPGNITPKEVCFTPKSGHSKSNIMRMVLSFRRSPWFELSKKSADYELVIRPEKRPRKALNSIFESAARGASGL